MSGKAFGLNSLPFVDDTHSFFYRLCVCVFLGRSIAYAKSIAF